MKGCKMKKWMYTTALVLGLIVMTASMSYGTVWDGSHGNDWFTDNNWTPRGEPSSVDDADFNINPSTVVIDNLDGDGPPFALNLNVHDGGVVTLTGTNGIPTLTLTNDLNVAFGDPESDITASMVIKDINVIGGIAKKLVVGHKSGSGSGTLTFESDTTATSEFDGKVRIGRGTTGTLNVKAGAILKLHTTASSISDEFDVGYNGGTGTINIFAGGTLEYGGYDTGAETGVRGGTSTWSEW